jgi:hypothetical protein
VVVEQGAGAAEPRTRLVETRIDLVRYEEEQLPDVGMPPAVRLTVGDGVGRRRGGQHSEHRRGDEQEFGTHIGLSFSGVHGSGE